MRLSHFLLFLLSCSAAFVFNPSLSTSSLLLDLHHHPAPPLAAGNLRLSYIRSLILTDQRRQETIRSTILQNACKSNAPPPVEPPDSSPAAFEMPIGSGSYTGVGQYFVRFRLGTPARPFLLVADTGSDLNWVKCRLRQSPEGHHRGAAAEARVFRPTESSSWAAIGCSTEMCKKSLPFSLARCPAPDSPCAYDYSYSDGSQAQGIFGNESATITLSNGKQTKLHGLVVGCTTNSSGMSFRASDGVLGLGYSTTSFATHASSIFGGIFSYCLVDHLSPRNLSSLLTFGLSPSLDYSLSLRMTPLILDPRLNPFYSVFINCISVDGETLDIPSNVWEIDAGGGMILDSGTSLTVLAEPAYRVVVSSLNRRLVGLERVQMDPFEYCYNWTGSGLQMKDNVPKLALHFDGAARLEPPVKSYIIDVADGVKCIGFTSAPWPAPSTIGNILQQEYVWEFDIRNQQLRFQRSKCEKY